MVTEPQRDQGDYHCYCMYVNDACVLRDLPATSGHAPPDKKAKNSPTKLKTASTGNDKFVF